MIALELAMIVEGAGFEIVGPAHSIEHARVLLGEQHVDTALLDVNVAGERVDDLAAVLARDNVSFAFLTGYGRDALPPAFASAALIPKPFMANQVLVTIRALLSPPASVA